MESRINSDKIGKYRELLYSLLLNIEENRTFTGGPWEKEQRVEHKFIVACKNLGYISVHGLSTKRPTYVSKLISKNVEPIHAKNVYMEMSRLRREEKTCTVGKQETDNLLTPKTLFDKLEHFTDEALMTELKRRGYIGRLTQTKTLEI